jgi:hypothetical protein
VSGQAAEYHAAATTTVVTKPVIIRGKGKAFKCHRGPIIRKRSGSHFEKDDQICIQYKNNTALNAFDGVALHPNQWKNILHANWLPRLTVDVLCVWERQCLALLLQLLVRLGAKSGIIIRIHLARLLAAVITDASYTTDRSKEFKRKRSTIQILNDQMKRRLGVLDRPMMGKEDEDGRQQSQRQRQQQQQQQKQRVIPSTIIVKFS